MSEAQPLTGGQETVRSQTQRSPLATFWRGVWAVLWKDLRSEWRTRDAFSAMLVFALMSVIVFNFGFDLRVENTRQVLPGVLWVGLAFAGTLGLNRSFVAEQDRGCLAGLLLSPLDRSAIYLGKMLGNLVFMLAVEVFMVPAVSIVFNQPLWQPASLLVLLLGTLGFVTVGTVFAAMAASTRAREAMLPILLLPVVMPVMMAAVKLTGGVLDIAPLDEMIPWWRLLVVYDVIALVAGYLTFEFVVEE